MRGGCGRWFIFAPTGQVKHFSILVLSVYKASAWCVLQEDASHNGVLDEGLAVDGSYGRQIDMN